MLYFLCNSFLDPDFLTKVKSNVKVDLGECSRTTCHNGGKCIEEYTSSGVNRFCNCSGPYTGRLDFIIAKSILGRKQYGSVGMWEARALDGYGFEG